MPMKVEPIKAEDIKSFFDQLTEKEIVDEELLVEFLLKRVGVGFRKRDFEIKEGEYLRSNRGFKIRQWPDELARFLIFLHGRRGEINSYLEFGTGSGGTFFVIDSYLRTINPNMERSLTIDQEENKPWFLGYKSRYPVDSFTMRVENFRPNRKYDLCFIDANHLYRRVRNDYNNLKDWCKFIALHDIATYNEERPRQKCVRHLWEEICQEPHASKTEIITTDKRVKFAAGGIGIIERVNC